MSRPAREYSVTGIYHVVIRGINKQSIFEQTSDYLKFKKIITKLKQELNFEIYVYCLMTNHVHILLKENNIGDIPLIMKRLLTGYAMYYNKKYDRTGPLFESRYKSRTVEIDEYFLAVVRYIHRNPIKAKMVENLQDYIWSSYLEYVKNIDGIADKQFVSEMLGNEDFISFHQYDDGLDFEINNRTRKTADEIKNEIITEYSVQPEEIRKLPNKQKIELLYSLNDKYSLRQIAEVTGISRITIKSLIN